MKIFILSIISILSFSHLHAAPLAPNLVNEVVYVETPVDTDADGKLDRLYVSITRPADKTALPTIYDITPYAFGGNDVPNHEVDSDRLPQDEAMKEFMSGVDVASKRGDFLRGIFVAQQKTKKGALGRGYAFVSAHSLGTGNSSGCPTVGDESETLAAKAVIDWLNGRAKAFTDKNKEIKATWASGSVGMTGVSYNGTLPNMVATTGVDGLKAIVPVAAISNWYNYYRANGLVVGPGGYVGEDADVLGYYIVRKGKCSARIQDITDAMGREHGDFTQFWEDRNYLTQSSKVRAAVFVVHGQSDWNVRQRHAIEWWEALAGVTPRRLWLHNGGHGDPSRSDYEDEVWAWFDRYVKGDENGVENKPAVEVQYRNGSWTKQSQWPSEATTVKRLFLNSDLSLGESPSASSSDVADSAKITDIGDNTQLRDLAKLNTAAAGNRLVFLSSRIINSMILSGTTRVHLRMSVLNRRAANITIAIIEYTKSGEANVVTRGWVDPQNHSDIKSGELLVPKQYYDVSFALEPKQHVFAKDSQMGVLVISTDYEHTLRPKAGTELEVALGASSFVDMHLE